VILLRNSFRRFLIWCCVHHTLSICNKCHAQDVGSQRARWLAPCTDQKLRIAFLGSWLAKRCMIDKPTSTAGLFKTYFHCNSGSSCLLSACEVSAQRFSRLAWTYWQLDYLHNCRSHLAEPSRLEGLCYQDGWEYSFEGQTSRSTCDPLSLAFRIFAQSWVHPEPSSWLTDSSRFSGLCFTSFVRSPARLAALFLSPGRSQTSSGAALEQIHCNHVWTSCRGRLSFQCTTRCLCLLHWSRLESEPDGPTPFSVFGQHYLRASGQVQMRTSVIFLTALQTW